MKYILTNKPQKINETKGEIQNVSVRHVIVLAAGTSIPSVDTSTITVRPGESYPFKTVLGEVLYAWIINANDDETLEVSVINFLSEGEGGDTDISAIETEIISQGKQIQNCYEKPHESLDYALWVENGELKEWSKDGKSKLQTSNQVGNGDSDTHSLNDKGLNGIIGQNDLYIGKGYENLIKNTALGNTSYTKDGFIFTLVCNTDDVTSKYITIESGRTIANTDYTLSWEVLEGIEHFNYGVLFGTSFDPQVQSSSPKGTLTSTSIADPAGNCGILYMKHDSPSGAKVVVKVSMTKTSIPVPYIKDSIPDGKCVLNSPWTSKDHSFIFSGFTPSSENLFFKLSNRLGIQSSQESFYMSQADKTKTYDAILSDSYSSIFEDDGTIYTGGVGIIDRGVTGGVVCLTRNLEYGGRANSFKGIYCYSYEITEEELDGELAKWKNGKIKLEPMGFVENIPNSKKRMDIYGNLKTYINATDSEKNEDICLANEGDMYEIIDMNGVSYVTVGVDGSITAGSKIKNVAGYVVTDDLVATYPLKLRVVK